MGNDSTHRIKSSLVETGGRTSQELGMGRIVGQVLVYLYLTEGDCSLDQIGRDLGLSKASASIGARQLEKLGLLKRCWKKGDRKNYYRTADNIETALRSGLISFVLQKIHAVGIELDKAGDQLAKANNPPGENPETQFVQSRVTRAKKLRDATLSVLENPVLKFLIK